MTYRVDEDPLAVVVSGEVRETDVYGADLLLRRTLRFPVGAALIEIEDEVVNQGYEPAVLMLLYHVNAGYPVVAEGARLIAPPATVVGRDDGVEGARGGARSIRAADRRLPADRLRAPAGRSRGVVGDGRDRQPGPRPDRWHRPVASRSNPRQLPRLWQWRMLAPGMYLTGLEPSNCGMRGRALEREAGAVDVLEPGGDASVRRPARGPNRVGGAGPPRRGRRERHDVTTSPSIRRSTS